MKINITQVLSESASFYKEHFKKMMGISFAVFVFTALMQVTGYTFTKQSQWLWLLVCVIVIYTVLIAMIIILPKLYMAMPILINSLLGKKPLTAKEAYRETGGKYWLMVRCAILIGIVYIPFISIVFTKIPYAAAISSVCMAFVSSLFYTLFPMIAIEPRTNQYIRRSVGMIKENYLSVLILTLLTNTLLSVILGILKEIFQGNTTVSIIIGVMYAAVCFFVYPFANTVSVMVYRQLKDKPAKRKKG